MLPRQLIPRERLREVERMESILRVQIIGGRIKTKRIRARIGLGRVLQQIRDGKIIAGHCSYGL